MTSRTGTRPSRRMRITAIKLARTRMPQEVRPGTGVGRACANSKAPMSLVGRRGLTVVARVDSRATGQQGVGNRGAAVVD